MRIDSHQHFWRYDPNNPEFDWIDASMVAIKRDFLPADLKPELAARAIDGCVAVQAAQSPEETEFLLELADSFEFVKGVVGWVDLCSQSLPAELDRLRQRRKLKGVRHVAQAEPDDFLAREAFVRGVAELAPRGLTYDILIHERQLPAALELVRRLPEQAFVLDHIAKPKIKARVMSPWAELIRELSREANVCCKVSGMVTEAAWGDWTREQLKPYLDVVFECFEPERLMFGSDWPVCNLAASYSEVFAVVEDYAAMLSEAAQKQLFGGTAVRFYRL